MRAWMRILARLKNSICINHELINPQTLRVCSDLKFNRLLDLQSAFCSRKRIDSKGCSGLQNGSRSDTVSGSIQPTYTIRRRLRQRTVNHSNDKLTVNLYTLHPYGFNLNTVIKPHDKTDSWPLNPLFQIQIANLRLYKYSY